MLLCCGILAIIILCLMPQSSRYCWTCFAMYSPPPSERRFLTLRPVSSSALMMNALRWFLTLDFSLSGVMPTQRNLLSVKVTKYLYPRCDCVGKGPHTLLNMHPSTCSECVEVVLWITLWVCLPLRHSSHSWVHGSLSEIIIPVTSPSSAMQVMALGWRWPRWRCHSSSEPVDDVSQVVKVRAGGSVMSSRREVRVATFAIIGPSACICMIYRSLQSLPLRISDLPLL